MKVKVIGVSGSPRKGNVDILVQETLAAARRVKDVETEFIHLGDYKYGGGCIGCLKCMYEPDEDKLCRAYKDDHNMILKRLFTADGFIFGSPVYFGGLTSQWKMFWDRTECCHAPIGKPLRNKPFGVVTCGLAHQGGQEHAIAELVREAMFHDMIPISQTVGWPKEGMAGVWGVAGIQGFPTQIAGHSEGAREAVKQHTAAMECCKILGGRVAEMAKVIKAGFTLVNPENGETIWPAGRLTGEYLKGDLEALYGRGYAEMKKEEK